MNRIRFTLLAYLGSLGAALAQPVTLTVPPVPPGTGNLYAQEEIIMNPGFAATAPGFEAVIKLPEAVAGRWSAPRTWTPYERGGVGTGITGMVGVHTHVMPSGKVLSWEGHPDSGHMAETHAYDWNPLRDTYGHHDIHSSNIFCSGHSLLANGNLLVAGGHYSGGAVYRRLVNGIPDPNFPVNDQYSLDYIPPGAGDVNTFIGLRDANIFHFSGNAPPPLPPAPPPASPTAWQSVPPMNYRRWYPTNTTLRTGEVVVVAGLRYGGAIGTNDSFQATIPEVYNATTSTWLQLTGAARQLPLYPWMFVAPNGRVFNAGPNVRTGFLDPDFIGGNGVRTGAWTDGPLHQLGRGNAPLPTSPPTPDTYEYNERGAGTAVMYRPGKILMMGGASSSTGQVTETAELIDLNYSSPAWEYAAPMRFKRHHVNSTLLADGTVLVTGGNQRYTQSDNDAVRHAELWQPGTKLNPGGTWTTMNAMTTPRLYHSTAVLLPDATVLSAGGGQGGAFQTHPDYEIFTPPYLCNGYARPQISSVPQAVQYGQPFAVRSPQAGSIVRATWVRLSSVTHSFNMNQLFMDLYPTTDPNRPGELLVTAPADPNVCPPGHYMLFLVDGNGTPSHAGIVAINTTVCASPVLITQPPPAVYSPTACSRSTAFVASDGPAGSIYDWTVNGVPFGSGASISVLTSAASPTVQVSVQARTSGGCGASATLTSYFPGCLQ